MSGIDPCSPAGSPKIVGGLRMVAFCARFLHIVILETLGPPRERKAKWVGYDPAASPAAP